jgi:signal transduction histidine kinase
MSASARAIMEQVDEQYRAALFEYLAAGKELALHEGYELGRAALSDGLGLLDMATMHARSLAAVMNAPLSDVERAELLDAQTTFMVEALSPFEMAHRAFRDANTLLRRLNDVMEGQAKRIAYTLHNEAGQLLASVHFALAEAARDLPPEKAAHLANVRGLLVEIEERLRNVSHELRPPVLNDLGLGAALELFAVSISTRWALPVTMSISLDGDLPASIENTVYRIVQEALTNVVKHAEANSAEVTVRQTSRLLVCTVHDDGIGFDDTAAFRKQRGIGLTEMKERVAALGGVVRLRLNQERGTDLTFEIPLEA